MLTLTCPKYDSHRRAAEAAEDIFFVWRADIAKQQPVLARQSVLLGPLDARKSPGPVPAGMPLLIQPAFAEAASRRQVAVSRLNQKKSNSALSATQR